MKKPYSKGKVYYNKSINQLLNKYPMVFEKILYDTIVERDGEDMEHKYSECVLQKMTNSFKNPEFQRTQSVGFAQIRLVSGSSCIYSTIKKASYYHIDAETNKIDSLDVELSPSTFFSLQAQLEQSPKLYYVVYFYINKRILLARTVIDKEVLKTNIEYKYLFENCAYKEATFGYNLKLTNFKVYDVNTMYVNNVANIEWKNKNNLYKKPSTDPDNKSFSQYYVNDKLLGNTVARRMIPTDVINQDGVKTTFGTQREALWKLKKYITDEKYEDKVAFHNVMKARMKSPFLLSNVRKDKNGSVYHEVVYWESSENTFYTFRKELDPNTKARPLNKKSLLSKVRTFDKDTQTITYTNNKRNKIECYSIWSEKSYLEKRVVNPLVKYSKEENSFIEKVKSLGIKNKEEYAEFCFNNAISWEDTNRFCGVLGFLDLEYAYDWKDYCKITGREFAIKKVLTTKRMKDNKCSPTKNDAKIRSKESFVSF